MRRSRRGRRSRGRLVAALFSLLLVLSGLGAWTGTASAAPGFCDARVAHDYERPFESMPPDDPPPVGELPFGPRNLSMYHVELGTDVVLAGKGFGYRFGAKDAGHRVLRLDWSVDAELWRIDSAGRDLQQVGAIHRQLGEVDDLDLLEFAFPGTDAGLYRLDIDFSRPDGPQLGSYDEYFHVVPAIVAVRLALGRSTFGPGETAYAQLRNYGTVGISAPQVFPVQRWVGGKWTALPSGPSITERPPVWLGTGEAARCSRFHIPADAKPGRYRFVATARILGSRDRRTLRAPFRVTR